MDGWGWDEGGGMCGGGRCVVGGECGDGRGVGETPIHHRK